MRKLLISFSLVFLILLYTFNDLYAQKAGYHDLGKLVVGFINSGENSLESYFGSATTFTYPQGFYHRELLQLWFNVFVTRSWINAQGGKLDGAYWTPEKNNPGIGKGISITTYKRFQPPTTIVNGMDITKPFIGKVDHNIVSDCYIDFTMKTMDVLGLLQRHQSWTYTNPYHDDYIIIRQDNKFTGDYDDDPDQDAPNQTIELAWYDGFCPDIPREAAESLPSRTDWGSGHTWVTWDSYNNYMNLSKSPFLVKNRDRKDLLISYAYNDDDIQTKAPLGYTTTQAKKYYDDRGVPDPKTGMFLGAVYSGFVVFHADKSASITSDDINEPKSLSWQTHSEFWSKLWRNGLWDFVTNPNNRPPAQWEFEGFPHNQITGGNMFIVQGVGPYSMNIGDDFTCVYALGVGSIDEDLCYTEGQKWWNWYWDLAGDKLDDVGKNALIATGKDSLFLNFNRAYYAFSKNMNIADPLPAPNIEVTSGPDQIEIKWGYTDPNLYKDPDTGFEDFYKWKLYRKIGTFEIDDPSDLSAYRKYELIGTFDKSTTSYIDKNVTRGVQYHYCVTALDDGSQNKDDIFPGSKLESSYYVNRSKLGAVAYKPGLNSVEGVLIVPNPYSISTGLTNMLNWPGSPDEVRFMNLPPYCTLKIYTSTGDLVKTIEHTSGSGDEAWLNLRTESNQRPASGVYILLIDNAKDLDKNPLPKKMYKFVIVR
jgi:hypothetical protein